MLKKGVVLVASLLFMSAAQAKNHDSVLESCHSKRPVSMTDYAKKNGKSYSGRVMKVSDGDTLQIQDTDGRKHKVRMAFIDAPEMKQASGKNSYQHLQKISLHKNVQVQVTDIDQYKREVAIVWQGQTDLNALQLSQGLAWHYETIAKRQQGADAYGYYACLQQEAKKQRVGLWANKQAQAPWQFRRSERSK